ncbi:hypothetical protein AMTR_s00051p00138730 [Amborella trichopoda]|uniref:Uncharacterized protein n=1 Tax=Amborella trichopoda TaxID=13333 RepID=U5D2K5_AMBTC|nr:hypothetical protein AMTR_s00051p00138730 [Amborella trichopoda]
MSKVCPLAISGAWISESSQGINSEPLVLILCSFKFGGCGERGTNRCDTKLNLSGSWQQGHSDTTIPPRVFKSSAKDSAYCPTGIALQGSPPESIHCGGLHQRHDPLACMSAVLLWVGKWEEGTCAPS